MNKHPHYFIGIKVPSLISRKAAQWGKENKEHLPFGVWTHPEDYHITLSFLGAVSEDTLKRTKEALLKISPYVPPFQLQATDIGVFGTKEKPRVLWLGIKHEENLFKLQESVQEACKSTGFKIDKRPYRPHITIAKKWRGKESFSYIDYMPNSLIRDEESHFHVESFSFFQIHPNRSPKYEDVAEFTLTGKDK